jgi:transcriptional regulator with XRE-family HTH domain
VLHVKQPLEPVGAVDLRELRTQLRLTQRAAALLVQVAPNTWARWERGELEPSAQARRLIALLPDLAPAAPTRKIPTDEVSHLLELLHTRDALLWVNCGDAAATVHRTAEETAARVFINAVMHMVEAGDFIAAGELLAIPLNAARALTIDEAREFISQCEWTFAKTMPHAPHEYIVRRKVENDKFVGLVKLIRREGERRTWGRYRNTYLAIDEWSYWTMGAPIPITIIINRARTGEPMGEPPPAKPKKLKEPKPDRTRVISLIEG